MRNSTHVTPLCLAGGGCNRNVARNSRRATGQAGGGCHWSSAAHSKTTAFERCAPTEAASVSPGPPAAWSAA
eukprot:15459552-Alexandrium_andersonii.AAC.1